MSSHRFPAASIPLSLPPVSVLLVAMATLLWGCEDRTVVAKQAARVAAERLLPVVERDTKQVRDGLPAGAKAMGPMLDEDPGADLASLQRYIRRARASVESLSFAKSTFFIFVDTKGKVLRSETDPDLPAGESLYEAIPAVKKLSSADAGLVETFGYLHGLRGVEKGGDRQWVVGHPVTDEAGTVKGSFVTGWSLRRYAQMLEDDARRQLTKDHAENIRAIPLMYVFLIQGDQAFGAPVTPEVSAKALSELGLSGKVKDGPFEAPVEVDGRKFFVFAQPCPSLGEGAAIAVLVSPV